MLLKNDFLNHWKTRLLCKRLGDGAALRSLLSLWTYCEHRRAWQFNLSPLELAGVCDFGGDHVKLYHELIELRFLIALDLGWFEVNGWGEQNHALVSKWPGRRLVEGEFYHPKGYIAKAIPEPIPPPTPQAIGSDIGQAIGLDRIGEDWIGLETNPTTKTTRVRDAALLTEDRAATSPAEPDAEPLLQSPKALILQKNETGGGGDEPWLDPEPAVRFLCPVFGMRKDVVPAPLVVSAACRTWAMGVPVSQLTLVEAFYAAAPDFRNKSSWNQLHEDDPRRLRKFKLDSLIDDWAQQLAHAERWQEFRNKGTLPKLGSGSRVDGTSAITRPASRLFTEVKECEPEGDWRGLLADNYPAMQEKAMSVPWAALPVDVREWLTANLGGES